MFQKIMNISHLDDYKSINIFKDFNIHMYSCLNLMPGANSEMEAYFTFDINNKEKFTKKYE